MDKCENQATLICIVDEGCPKKVTNRRKVNFKCQFVPSRPVLSTRTTMFTTTTMTTMTNMTTKTTVRVVTMMTMVTKRKLYEEVGGCTQGS